ncbi:MAG TPA: 50S ribosomal protein L4 [Patescibacteria group bacterium]|nr:50S ribosomal protein L4 [Patescibacteria group bacterium]
MPKELKTENKKITKKTVTAKPAVKSEKKVVVKEAKPASKPVAKASNNLSISVFGIDGSKKGTVSLSAEIFGAPVNTSLMSQAVRVYLVNQRQGTAATKTRGEVTGSTRKIYRQKGTGKARHGAITAPIFVGGGIAFGPRPRIFDLKMSKQMRRKALFSALSFKNGEGKVFVVDVNGASGKTKEMSKVLKTMGTVNKDGKANKVLFVTEDEKVKKTVANIGGLTRESAHVLNTYSVLNSNFIVFEKNALVKAEEAFLAKKAAVSESGDK